MSDSVRPHRRQPIRLPHPWDSPGKNTGVGCHFLLQCMKVKSESEVAQSCLTLSDPMDCNLLGSSVHGILQARVLEWGAFAFSMSPLMIHQRYFSFLSWCLAFPFDTFFEFPSLFILPICFFMSVTQLCPTLCEPMNCSTPGLPVHHQLLEFTQTHVHQVGDTIQPSHPLSSPSPPAPNTS